MDPVSTVHTYSLIYKTLLTTIEEYLLLMDPLSTQTLIYKTHVFNNNKGIFALDGLSKYALLNIQNTFNNNRRIFALGLKYVLLVFYVNFYDLYEHTLYRVINKCWQMAISLAI